MLFQLKQTATFDIHASAHLRELSSHALTMAPLSLEQPHSNTKPMDAEQCRMQDFVQLPSSAEALKAASQAIFEARPVLVDGPMGCGKTRLVEHLALTLEARQEFKDFHRIQMSDQTDAR